MEDFEQVIHASVLQIAQQKSVDIAEVSNEQKLNADLGLSSLDLAQLVAVLELRLSADPFAKLVPITSIRTVGDLCDAYRKYFANDGQDEQETPSFSRSQARARLRRRSQ